jgi:hypothetical protein
MTMKTPSKKKPATKAQGKPDKAARRKGGNTKATAEKPATAAPMADSSLYQRLATEHGLEWSAGVQAALRAAYEAGVAGRPRRPREGGKRDVLAGLLLRPEGATRADLLEASGWPAISVPALARSAGITLRTEKEGPALRYYGQR